MYVPKHFEETDPEILAELMRAFSFALLVTSEDGRPVGTHLPLHLGADGDQFTVLGHVARANDHWRQFDGKTEALCVFQGPHAYISPNWYESDGMVPTWNYAVVHAYGRPRAVEDAGEAAAILARLVGDNESDATGNWSMESLPPQSLQAQLKGIVAFEMPIERIEGKWKMSQNRATEDAQGAAQGLRHMGGADDDATADAMEVRLKSP